jgi:hypothetical protein
MDNITNSIINIKVKGYDDTSKKYKFLLILEGDNNERKVNIMWDKIQKGLKKIKKDINKNVYAKLMYDLELNVVIKDAKYNSLSKFVKGIPCKKNERKISDIQNLFNRLIHNKNDDDVSNKMAVLSMFEKTFGIIN